MVAEREFEWDEAKATSNKAKHGTTFITATQTFKDPSSVDYDVSRIEDGEQRRKVLGMVDGRLITVVYVLRSGVVRVISARPSNRAEERRYGDRSLRS